MAQEKIIVNRLEMQAFLPDLISLYVQYFQPYINITYNKLKNTCIKISDFNNKLN